MNIKLYKEEWLFMVFSIVALTVVACMGNDGFDICIWQDQMMAVLDFVANETPHS